MLLAAEEYNDETEIAVIRLRKMTDCGAPETGRKFEIVQNGNVQVSIVYVEECIERAWAVCTCLRACVRACVHDVCMIQLTSKLFHWRRLRAVVD